VFDLLGQPQLSVRAEGLWTRLLSLLRLQGGFQPLSFLQEEEVGDHQGQREQSDDRGQV